MGKKWKKILTVILVAALMITSNVMPELKTKAAYIFDGAIEIEELDAFDVDNGWDTGFYKIVIPSDGDIILRNTNISWHNGIDLPGYELYNPKAELVADGRVLKNNGTCISNLKKGTYYLRMFRSYPFVLENFYYVFTPSEKPSITPVIKIPVGTKLQLAATVTNSKSKVTWSSSKKSYATVSSTGVVTAKKKGSTIIKARLATGEYFEFKITVTSK